MFICFFYFAFAVKIPDDRLEVIDYTANPFLAIDKKQEILFKNIDCIYYLEKEEEPKKSPFLLTKLNLSKIEKIRKIPIRGFSSFYPDIIHWCLVLSNQEGNLKIYISRFNNLCDKDKRQLISVINKKKHTIEYLMSDPDIQHLTNSNFKPGIL